MIEGCTLVLDIGKTNAKLSLWDARGGLLIRRTRANQVPATAPYRTLDVSGIDAWLMATLQEFSSLGDIRRIVPVGHGAAAAVLHSAKLHLEPMDYEEPMAAGSRNRYDQQRDPFSLTGSPALPCGLNLGMQLHRLEEDFGPFPDDVTILPWPQYWAWRLCGVAASEVSSLGCHSDLWRPVEGRMSDLAQRRGWAKRMAPLRRAREALAPVSLEICQQTGLNRDCVVLCGLHDSNAALLAARGHQEITGESFGKSAGSDATVLSTGTWFVAMRSLAPQAFFDTRHLHETRDCLVNVDVESRPVPSARFMGGREWELIAGLSSFDLNDNQDPDALLHCLPAILTTGASARPSFVQGVGPYPRTTGGWHLRPESPMEQRAAAGLYLALIADTSLGLIGSRDRLLIEGRFAEEAVFVRALASLRPEQRLFTSNAEHDVAYGALRLIDPDLPPPARLTPVKALDLDLRAYAARWREQAQQGEVAA